MAPASDASPESFTTKVAAHEALDNSTPAKVKARGRSGVGEKDGLCGMVVV
jgi:hypothetical protein